MLVYKPNSVVLSENLRIERQFPEVEKLKGKNVRFDTKTIFYDFFYDPKTNRLHGIGPRLLNLKSEIFPLRVYVNHKNVQFRLYEIERLILFESDTILIGANGLTGSSEKFNVKLQFKNFEHVMEIDLDWEKRNLTQNIDAPLTISTQQKDNYFVWISDWILWHRRLHDVRRVVIYDNGSKDQNVLIEQLESLEPEVQIIFVHWPFPHGLDPYNFTQRGSLNHCRMKFSIPGGYCINLDIDEYLVSLIDQNIVDYLNSKLEFPSQGVAHLKEMRVPNIVNFRTQDIVPRCFDFIYRFQKFGDRPIHYGNSKRNNVQYRKYIYRFDGGWYNDVHLVLSEKTKTVAFSRNYKFRIKFNFLVNKFSWKFKRIFFKGRFVEYPKPTVETVRINDSEFYFYHFLGLSNNWKNLPVKDSVAYNYKIHVQDPLVATLAQKAGLLDQ